MKILSLDASSTCIGWSIWDNDKLLEYGKFKQDEKLHWRLRLQELTKSVNALIKKNKIKEIYLEDVPLMGRGGKGKATLVTLGAVQGAILSLACFNDIPLTLVPVSTWRKNIGLYDGTKEGMERDNMKIKSIQKVNDMFGIDLKLSFTKSGKYSGDKSDDDIADSILLYASTIHKYCKSKGFGKGVK